ncbi:MAG: exo-alpha-sialidase, partial [Chlorobi bacterium]|nr:exo-alpha-sialidase [Chlorobiota bacterium]
MKKIIFIFLFTIAFLPAKNNYAQSYNWELFFNFYFINNIEISSNGYFYISVLPQCVKEANQDLNFVRLFKTTNDGVSWQPLIEVLPESSCDGVSAVKCDENNNVYVCFPYPQLIKSSDYGVTWDTLSNPAATYIHDVVITQSGNLITSCYDYGVYLSTDSGASWQLVIDLPTNFVDKSLYLAPNGYIYALAYMNNELYRSTDNGVTWTKLNVSIDHYALYMSSLEDGTLFLGSINYDNSPLLKSTDYGDTWETATDFFSGYSGIGPVFTTQTNSLLVAAGNPSVYEVFYSEDGGNNWKIVYTNEYYDEVTCFAQDSSGMIYIGTGSGVYRIEESALPVELISFSAQVNNDGDVLLNWTTASETNNKGFQVERKKEKEESIWENITFVEGSGTTSEAKSYSYEDQNLEHGKYFYRLKQIDFDGSFEYGKEIEVEVAPIEKFGLSQNYPNPFGKASVAGTFITTIEFELPKSGKTELKVFDILGKEIAILENGFLEAGKHTSKFDATG